MNRRYRTVDASKRALVLMSFVSVVSICRPVTGLSQETESAAVNVLIVEAGQLIRSADDTVSLGDRISMLEDARDKLQSVLDNYPAHDFALRLATGQSIGAVSLAGVEEAIDNAMAECWNEPTMACVSRLVEQQAASSRVCEDKRVYFAALELAWTAFDDSERADDAMRRRAALDGACSDSNDSSANDFEFGSAGIGLDIGSVASASSTPEQIARLVSLARGSDRLVSQVFEGLLMGGSFSAAAEMADSVAAAMFEVRPDGGINPTGFIDIELALARARHDVLQGSTGNEHFDEAVRIAALASRSGSLIEIAKRQAALGFAEGASATVDLASEVRLSGEAFEWNSRQLPQIARAQFEIGEDDEAQRTLQRAAEESRSILDHGGRSQRLTEIAEVQLTLGRSDDARSLLELAYSAALEIRDPAQRSERLRGIADVQLSGEFLDDAWGTLDRALEASRMIEDVGARARALAGVGSALATTGQTQQAKEAFADADAEISSIQDSSQRAITYLNVLLSDVDDDAMHAVDPTLMLDRASAAFDQAELSDDLRVYLREAVPLRVRARYGIAQTETISMEIERLIRTPPETDWITRQFAEQLVAAALAGRLYGLAIDALTLVDDAAWRTDRLREVSTAQLESGDRDGAIATWEMANMSLEDIGQFSTFLEVASHQTALGLNDAARATLDTALTNIREADKYSPRYWASDYSMVSVAEAELGDIEGARRTLDLANASLNRRTEFSWQGEYEFWLEAAKTRHVASGDFSSSATERQRAVEYAVQFLNSTEDMYWFNSVDVLYLVPPENTGNVPSLVEATQNWMVRYYDRVGRAPFEVISEWAAVEASTRTNPNNPSAYVQSLVEQFFELFPGEREQIRTDFLWREIAVGVASVFVARGDLTVMDVLGINDFSRRNIIFDTDSKLPLSEGRIRAMLAEGDFADDLSKAARAQFNAGLTNNAMRLASAVPTALETTIQHYFYGGNEFAMDFDPFADLMGIMPVYAHLGMTMEAKNVLTRTLVAYRERCLQQPRLEDSSQDSCNSAYILGNILIWTAVTEAMARRGV